LPALSQSAAGDVDAGKDRLKTGLRTLTRD
jgi:hypothetical protein